MKNTKGFISVFLVIILLSLVILTSVISEGAHTNMAVIQGQRAVSLAGRSVLAEYDIHLKKAYGIFAIEGDSEKIARDVTGYMNRMLTPQKEDEKEYDFLYRFSVDKVEAGLEDYSMLNTSLLKQHMVQSMEYALLDENLEVLVEKMDTVKNIFSGVRLITKLQQVIALLSKMESETLKLRDFSEKNMIFIREKDHLTTHHEKYLKNNRDLIDSQCSLNLLENLRKKLVRDYKKEIIDEEAYISKVEEIRQKTICLKEELENLRDDDYPESYDAYILDCNQAIKTINTLEDTWQEAKVAINTLKELLKEEGGDENIFGEEMGEVVEDMVKVVDICHQDKLASLRNRFMENKFLLIEVREALLDCQDNSHFIRWSKQYTLPASLAEYDIEAILQEVDRKIETDTYYTSRKNRYIQSFESLMKNYQDILDKDIFETALKIYEKFEEKDKEKFPVNTLENKNQETEKSLLKEQSKRILANSNIIQQLPSQSLKKDWIPILKAIENFDTAVFHGEAVKEEIIINAYMTKRFNHHLSQERGENFFANEIEYILYGHYEDEKNYNAFIRDVMMIRNTLNLIHIYSDPVKRNQTLEAALSIVRGVGTPVVQFAIASAWAHAEALIDVREIKEGKKSPFIKSKDNWHLAFEDILKGNVQSHRSGDSPKEDEDGIEDVNRIDYEDYLKILLYIKNQENTLYRALDIIQINMKNKYYQDFDVRDYYLGCSIQASLSLPSLFLHQSWMPKDIRKRKTDKKRFVVKQEHQYY